MQAVTESGATRVIDLGCGEGKLLKELLKQKEIQEIAGMDVSHRSLEIASERMHFDTMPPKQKERIRLFQGSLMYKDGRLAGFETATASKSLNTWTRRGWPRSSVWYSSTPSRTPSSSLRPIRNTTCVSRRCLRVNSGTRIIDSSGRDSSFNPGPEKWRSVSGTP